MKESFLLYTKYAENIEMLTMEQRGILFTAIMNYAAEKDLPEMDGMVKMAFSFIRVQMDADTEKYNDVCRKRAEAGKMGGRPKKEEKDEKANGFSDDVKKANGFLEKQTKAKKPDNDNEYVNVNDNVNENVNENDNENEVIRYQQIADMYNDTCVSFPRLTRLSERRRKAIRARLKAGYTLDDFQRLFELAESSEFLKGGNGRNWYATFDWLIQDGNMAKVLDGNYQSREPTQKGENHDTGGKNTGYDKYLQDFIKSGGKIPEFTGF